MVVNADAKNFLSALLADDVAVENLHQRLWLDSLEIDLFILILYRLVLAFAAVDGGVCHIDTIAADSRRTVVVRIDTTSVRARLTAKTALICH